MKIQTCATWQSVYNVDLVSDVSTSPKTSPPPSQAQKPNSFLFRTSSRSNVKPIGTNTVTHIHTLTHCVGNILTLSVSFRQGQSTLLVSLAGVSLAQLYAL